MLFGLHHNRSLATVSGGYPTETSLPTKEVPIHPHATLAMYPREDHFPLTSFLTAVATNVMVKTTHTLHSNELLQEPGRKC